MIRWLSYFTLLTSLVACNDAIETLDPSKKSNPVQESLALDTSTPIDEAEQKSPATNSSFSLEKVKQQYSGITLTILDASIQNIKEQPALTLSLSVPLNPALNHQANLQVMDDDEQLVDGAWQLSDNGRQLYFTAIEAETNYHIKVLTSLTAATDVNLTEPFEAELKTEAALAGVSFTSQKTVLVANEAKGLAISAINTPNVDIDFFRIDLKQYPQYENSWYERSQNKDSWELRRALKYSTPVYSGRFELDLPKNTRKTLYIDTASIAALQPVGFYLAVMKASATFPDVFSTATFIVSDLGLHIRQYDQGMHVYTSSLKTGKAMNLVDIQVMDNKGNTLIAQQSDDEGIARFLSLPKGAQYVIGKHGQQIALVNLQDAALDLSEFSLAKDLAASQSLFIYSARDLFRPGETVDLFALLRNLDGSMAVPLALKARLLQPDGQELKSFQWQPQNLSSYHYQLQLPQSAKTGLWSLEVELADKFIQQFSFHVEDFLPERMNLLFVDNESNDRHQIFHSDPLNIKVTGEYLYGAPAAGNTLESELHPRLLTEPFEQLPGFQFGNVLDENNLDMLYLEDRQLDNNGQAVIHSNNIAQNTQSPVRLRITASLLENGGRPVTRHYNLTSLPANKLVGIRPVYNDGLDHFEANTLASFEVIRVNAQAKNLSAKDLQVKLIHERRDYHWVNRGAGWSYEFNEKHYTSFETSIDITTDQNRIKLELPIEWGLYRLEITDPETKLTTSTRVTAGSTWWGEQDQTSQGTRPDQIKLSWDKASYKAGETAQLTMLPPYAGEGFVVLESDKPLWGQRITIPKEGLSINIPVTKDWKRSDIYATAVIFRPSNQVDLITPKRALGLLHLPLDRSKNLLDIKISSPDKIEPNKKLNIQLQAQFQGQPLQNQKVQIQLMAVDVGVLNITDFATPDPHQWLFKPRRLRVESHDMYGDIVEYLKADLARQKFGGDADLAQGGEQAKADVQIISLLQPVINFDENGQANFELDIPDFNGRLRLMAVAFGEDQFGSTDKEINVAAPIIAEIAMPRFIARNDQAHITLELQNLTDHKQNISTTLQSTDPLEISSNTEHQVTLAPKERTLLHYQVTARSYGKGQFLLKLNNEDSSIHLQREWALTSRSPYPAESYKFSQVIQKDEVVILPNGLSDTLIPSGTAATLSISDQAPIDVTEHIENLLQYPYGCLEQTSSRVYPLLFADKKAIKKWQINSDEWTQKKRFAQIDNGLTHISSMQLYNGGFGLWDNDSREEFWLTAYVSHMLLDAQQQGIDIPVNQQKKALTRLGRYIKSPLAIMNDSRGNNKKAHRFAYKAYAAYVLSRLKMAPISQLRKLFNFNKHRTESILPMLHMALALQQQGDHKRANEALQKVVNIKRSDTYLADYGSQVRDLAMASYLMLHHQLAIPGQNWLFELSEVLRDRKWLSTQERNALFLLGNALENIQHKKWLLEVNMGDNSQTIRAEGTKSRILPWQQLQQQISLLNKSEIPLYSSFRLTGYPQTAPANMDNDLSIQRRYYNKMGEEINLDLIKQSELVVVSLSVESDNNHPDTLIVDMLPAGFEIENQNLGNSISLEQIKINEKSISELQQKNNIVHQQSLDDRFIAAVKVSKYQSANVFYLMRAITPGSYQIPAAFAEDMYRPEVRSIFNNEFTQVTIHAK